MIDPIHAQHIPHERFESRVSIRNILGSQKVVVSIAAGSAGKGGYRSGNLYHRRPRNKQDKLSDETSETINPEIRSHIPSSSSTQLRARHNIFYHKALLSF